MWRGIQWNRRRLMGMFSMAIGSSWQLDRNKEEEICCGIIGVVGTQPNAREILLEGLTVSQNRGYDSGTH